MVQALKVVAPATLAEGYSFDATLDGRTFRVTVPEGGVTAGQEFTVCDSHEIIEAVNETPETASAPQGHWRKHIFACVDVMFRGTFWMALCCPQIMTAQLMTRFKLDWLSRDAPPENVRRTFVILAIVFAVFASFLGWLPEIPVFILYAIFLLFIQTRLRRNARRRYEIPGNVIFDFILVLFCGCCSNIQMARHTHDENEYPYEGCAPDGLPVYAPPLKTTTTSERDAQPTQPPSDETTVTVEATIV